jgi:pimeloyl-ACP methyl ester carboxylesterase
VRRPERLDVDLDVLGQRMSALVAHADQPRAVVLALHGGGSSKEYFDTPLDPALSLLRLGPAIGFTVVAPDRPGYGPDGLFLDTMDPAGRTDLLYATVDAALAGRPAGGGLFVLCHSMGCVSGLRMAADERGRVLLGIELSGTGLTQHTASRDAFGGADAGESPEDRQLLRRLIWGPDELYPEGTLRGVRMPPAPTSEGSDAAGWPAELPDLAGRVTVPVRYTLAEHESWWRPDEPGLREVADLFTSAPVVETAVEPGAGHNISLGFTARAYHLRVLAFAEQCLVRRGAGRPAAQGGNAW